MKIEHAALYVKDLESEKDFFVKYFGGKPNEKYHNTKTGFQSYFLTFDGGTRLELMRKSEMPDLEKSFNHTGWAHVAFSLGSRERVDELTAQLRMDGYEIVSGPRVTGDGYYESCFLDREGNQFELTE